MRALRLTLFVFIAAAAGCTGPHAVSAKRVIVLGLDGMDYGVTSKLIAEGKMPNFAKVAAAGTFSALATTVPPQSPVAWSTFITGLDPNGHGIFDFVHRDPRTMTPYLSTSRTEASQRLLKIGRFQFPLSSGKVQLLRRGRPFWDVLERQGISTTIVRMPANFPPSNLASYELSGMGTPDLIGSYGTFSFYTSRPERLREQTPPGGVIYPVDVVDDVVRGALTGPSNPFLVSAEQTKIDFLVYVDPTHPFVKLVIGDEERVLGEGEWSDWIPVEFPLIPTQSISGACRFYLKRVRPAFELYASPINIDPLDPAMPISHPPDYAAQLARRSGRFYSQGMPEDTKALESGVLTRDEFLAQARVVDEENRRQYRQVLDRFDRGLLFFYVGNLDQVSHMLWRPRDQGHPAYDHARDPAYRSTVDQLYVGLDALVGEAVQRLNPDDTLVVMSDHGFTSWRRTFNLNSWLRENGYIHLLNPERVDSDLFRDVDWSRTRAYGLGLNSLYINLKGRETTGIVDPRERDGLLEEISRKLVTAVDPGTGAPLATRVYRPDRVFKPPTDMEIAPDLIIGYSEWLRSSPESALGTIAADVFGDNTGEWSGDHCMDPSVVPGILLTNRRLRKSAPSLEVLAAAILAEFGIESFP